MELNEFGKRVWKHKCSKILFAEQSYGWVRRVSIIQEDGNHRRVIEQYNLTDFERLSDNWEPMTKEEHDSVERQYKEIYNEQQCSNERGVKEA